MKTKAFIFCLIMTLNALAFSNTLYSQQIGEKYSKVIPWNGKDEKGKISISGNVRIEITVLNVNENGIRIKIQKDMTPYGQVLILEVDSEKKGDIYTFEGKDNWGDIVYGDFQAVDSGMAFFIDCNSYSNEGKDVSIGRLFGDRYLLEKKEILFE